MPKSSMRSFPDLAGALRRQFDIHTIIGGAVDEPQDLARLAAGRPQQPAAPAVNRPPPSARMGGFRVLAEMARGGMGVVYKAQHCELGRVVALKRVARNARCRSNRLARAGPFSR